MSTSLRLDGRPQSVSRRWRHRKMVGISVLLHRRRTPNSHYVTALPTDFSFREVVSFFLWIPQRDFSLLTACITQFLYLSLSLSHCFSSGWLSACHSGFSKCPWLLSLFYWDFLFLGCCPFFPGAQLPVWKLSSAVPVHEFHHANGAPVPWALCLLKVPWFLMAHAPVSPWPAPWAQKWSILLRTLRSSLQPWAVQIIRNIYAKHFPHGRVAYNDAWYLKLMFLPYFCRAKQHKCKPLEPGKGLNNSTDLLCI